MTKTTNYIIITKELENGKYLISFPDFEGVTNVAETEDTISVIATNTIKNKLSEMKKARVEIPEPLKIKDVTSTLKSGEFTSFIPITNLNFDFKNLSSNIPNKEALKEGAKEVGEKVDNFINSDIKNKVPEGKENLPAMIAGAISLVSTLLFSIISIDSFLGSYKINFFGGLSKFSSFSKEIKNISTLLTFSGIVFIGLACLFIYAGYSNNKEFLKYTIFSKIGFLIVFYTTVIVKIPKEASKFVSVSFFKILLYLISIALAYASLILMKNKTQEKKKEEDN
ncbi:MAG: type II toxin-antitoxin system HicB family antitoxin [Fusobacterium sp.]|nr:type II toxin-antitoxin system HicB family antitoxin [Fusobacterium sp.]